jgi:hypothetical protein
MVARTPSADVRGSISHSMHRSLFMNRTHALSFISLFIAGTATAFFACSSNDTSSGPVAAADSGTKDTGSGQDTALAADTNPAPDSGAVDTAIDDTGSPAVDSGPCSKVGSLHPPSADAGTSTIFCPFSAVGDAGKDLYCTGKTQHCCETPASAGTPSTCDPLATACPVPKSTDWQCQDPVADCPSATPVCCAAGASIGLGATGCGNFAHSMTGTKCVAAGACTGIVMCTADAECPSGQHCTPFTKSGAQVGGCM